RMLRKYFFGIFFVLLLFPFVLPSLYWLSTAIYILALALFSLSYDIMLGQTGILSFGHAACLGLGGYGVYWAVSAGLPFAVAVLVAIALGAVINIAMGISLFRVKGVYFAMFTLAFAEVIHLFLGNQVGITGGATGVPSPRPEFMSDPSITLLFLGVFVAIAAVIYYVLISSYIRRGELVKGAVGMIVLTALAVFGVYNSLTIVFPSLQRSIVAFTINSYLLSLFVLFVSYYLVSRLSRSPLGSVLTARRENEERTRMLGYNTTMYKLISLAISGMFAGLAGALFVSLATFITTPDILGSTYTLDVLLYNILGGIGTFVGPIIGTFVIEFLHFNIGYISGLIGLPALATWWMLIIGVFYILVVLFIPYGIVGTLRLRGQNVRRVFRKILGLER
ncbi:MAG: branched-chain amino acid ABC transporter permease, partial [Thaumarchaeota archaeon]|nr:branched-chain amino acid ABC transporter permease [Nitrososphaerota archaeon]